MLVAQEHRSVPQVTITPGSRSYRLLDPIDLYVELRNDSSDPLHLLVADTPQNNVDLCVVDSDGHPVSKTQYGDLAGAGDNGNIESLSPGKSFGMLLYLDRIYDMTHKGRYQVSYRAFDSNQTSFGNHFTSWKSFIIDVKGPPKATSWGNN
jgi:hypothetical protein